MPKLTDLGATTPIKGLYVGDAGSGKTGSLESLATKYKLRIWNFDNLLEPLFQFTRKNHPDALANIEYMTFTDKLRIPGQPIQHFGDSAQAIPFYSGSPTAFINALKALDKWEDGSVPRDWGMDTICIFDTLTTIAQAAFRYCWAMDPGCKDKRNVYRNAQQFLLNMLQMLCAEDFHPHVLILAHVDYSKNEFDLTKGLPRTIGAALNEQIAGYFNSVFLAQTQVIGSTVKRTIRTKSTGIIELKNPVSFAVPDELPLETGLLSIFEAIRPPTLKG